MHVYCQWPMDPSVQKSRSCGLLHPPCGAFGCGAWQRVITHTNTHTLCVSCMRVCLLLGEPAGQYFRAAIRGGCAINIITVGWKISCTEREDEKIQQERKTNAGRGSSNGCKSQQACKQTLLFSHRTQTPLIVDYHLTAAPCHSTTGCAGLSVSQLDADWPSRCEWLSQRVKKKRDHLPTAALMMPRSINEPGAINNHTPSFSCTHIGRGPHWAVTPTLLRPSSRRTLMRADVWVLVFILI